MKKSMTMLSIVALFAMLFATGASAQSNIPGGGWWSGQQVQNVGTDTANIDMVAYDIDPNVAAFTMSKSAAPGEAPTFLPSDMGDVATFQGSAVVMSDQPIKAIVNVTNRLGGQGGIEGGYAAAQYQGIDGSMVADTLYFPLVKGDSYNKTTTFFVQNAGDTATTITALFTMRNGDTHTWTSGTIEPNRMVIFSVLDATTFAPSDNAGRVGGLVVTSSGAELAGVVMEHITAENPATILQSTRGFTSGDFDTKLYAPVIKNMRYGRFTGIQVQNVSSGPVDITVTYKASACTDAANVGQSFVDSQLAVPAGTSHTFVNLTSQGTNLPEGCTASATIVATGDIVAVVNESFGAADIPASGQSSVTSSALADGAATTKISVPLFKDDRYDKRTGLQIQNVGTVDATNIVATFSCSGAATFEAVSLPQTATPGGAVLFIHPSARADMFTTTNAFSAANVNCGVTVTSDQPVVAIANESVPGGMGFTTIQDNNNYEGFNVAP